MSITLIQAAQDVRQLLSCVDPETGEIVDTYSASTALFEQKAVGCVAYAKEKAAEIKAAEALLHAMAERLDQEKERHQKFLGYISECMKVAGQTEVRGDAGLFGAKLYLGRDESVELQDGVEFPPELCNDPKPPAPSKTKIKQAIKAGQVVAGASLVRKDRLTFY